MVGSNAHCLSGVGVGTIVASHCLSGVGVGTIVALVLTICEIK